MHQKRKKKILFVLQLPPPVHGASMMNKHVVESRLIRQHFDTEVINLQFARNMQEIEKFSFRKLFMVFTYAWEILRGIHRGRPDLIYFTFAPRGFAFYRDLLYALLMKTGKGKKVYHLHGKGFGKAADRNVLNGLLTRWVFRNSSAICLSEKLTEDIKNIYTGKPYIVPNGIAGLTRNRSLNGSHKTEAPVILYLSNYLRDKGVLVLIEALKILHDQGLEFRARLVGAPGDLSIAELEDKLAALRIADRVLVAGPRYGEDKVAEFQHADLFVFPTHYANEAFPLVNLEAMQFALPVISTDEGGIPDMLIDGKTGFIVESRNAAMLAEKIAILLADKPLRRQMGAQALERFEAHYTLAHFEKNLNGVFHEILDVAPKNREAAPEVSQATGNSFG